MTKVINPKSLTTKCPLSDELDSKLFNSYKNKDSYAARISEARKLLEVINDIPDYINNKLTTIHVSDIPVDIFIKCIEKVGITNSNIQKGLICIIIKLASLEGCSDKFKDNRPFMQLSETVIANNYIIRDKKTLDKMPINWEEVIKKSDEYLNKIYCRYKSTNEGLICDISPRIINMVIMAAMIRDMPILRSGEYHSIMLEDNREQNYNYMKHNYNKSNLSNNKDWSFILRNHKSKAHHGIREIPIPQSVIDIMVLYGKDFFYSNNDQPIPSLFKNDNFYISTKKTPLTIVKKLYGADVTIKKLRIISASNSSHLDIESRVKLSVYMGHTFDCHKTDYEYSE